MCVYSILSSRMVRILSLLSSLVSLVFMTIVSIYFFYFFLHRNTRFKENTEINCACHITDCHEVPFFTKLFVYVGRWKFLRIQFPYLFRSLRINGGVIDVIEYLMFEYDESTLRNLKDLASHVNLLTGECTVSMIYLDMMHGSPEFLPSMYNTPYYIFEIMKRQPYDIYFHLRDDVVYIHPQTFSSLLTQTNFSHCEMVIANSFEYAFNSKLYQETDFQLYPTDSGHAKLNAFFNYYYEKVVDVLLFDNMFEVSDNEPLIFALTMWSWGMVNIRAIQNTWHRTDNDNWRNNATVVNLGTRPNCVIADTLVFIFPSIDLIDYSKHINHFENIVVKEIGRAMPNFIWNALGLLDQLKY